MHRARNGSTITPIAGDTPIDSESLVMRRLIDRPIELQLFREQKTPTCTHIHTTHVRSPILHHCECAPPPCGNRSHNYDVRHALQFRPISELNLLTPSDDAYVTHPPKYIPRMLRPPPDQCKPRSTPTARHRHCRIHTISKYRYRPREFDRTTRTQPVMVSHIFNALVVMSWFCYC